MIKKYIGFFLLLAIVLPLLPLGALAEDVTAIEPIVVTQEPEPIIVVEDQATQTPVQNESGGGIEIIDPAPTVNPGTDIEQPNPGQETGNVLPTLPPIVAEEISISTPTVISGGMGVGDTIIWSFRAGGADRLTYKVEYNGSVYLEGALPASETSFSVTPSQPGQYTLTITAWRGSESRSARSPAHQVQSAEAGGEPLTVVLNSNNTSFFYGQTVSLSANIAGGTAPYSTHITLSYGGGIVAQGQSSVSYTFERSGEYIATVQVTDAFGLSASDTRVIPCALNRTESLEDIIPYVTLTGDWATDIVQVAQSQLGYAESATNYILDADGKTHGYTRYGDWYDQYYNNGSGSDALLYGNWCAMFVSFCADIAQIPTSALPRHTGTSSWAKMLREMGTYVTADQYKPAKGDIVFIKADIGSGSINHIGIVLECTGGMITTIEGNANKKVDVRTYAVDSKQLKGYAPISQMQHPYATEPASSTRQAETQAPIAQAPQAQNAVVSVEVALAAANLANAILMNNTGSLNTDTGATIAAASSTAPPTRSSDFERIVEDIIQLVLNTL